MLWAVSKAARLDVMLVELMVALMVALTVEPMVEHTVVWSDACEADCSVDWWV